MKERLINEYVNRMNLDDVNKFALQNGINLKDDELRLIYTYIKNDWRTIVFGNPRGILDDLKNNKKAYVFYEEQVQAVKELFKGKLLVEKKDDIFYLTAIKKYATI